jgi:Cu/Ag efflux pump CusA
LFLLSTGIRTQVGVKVFGTDLKVPEEKSVEIERALRDVPGAVHLYAERITVRRISRSTLIVAPQPGSAPR